MKYICTKDENGKEEIFTFPKTVNHDVMAESLDRMRNQAGGNWHRVSRVPVSAGFVTPSGVCFGESLTLNLKSRSPEDSDLLGTQFGWQG
jgi:hypothetical protein